MRKDRLDGFGATALTGFALFLALNQIIIKLVNDGLQPVFFAGLRSLIALVCLSIWLGRRGALPDLGGKDRFWGVTSGLFFAAEFIFMFIALDLTSVTRVAILLYSMPIWMALGSHFLLPGETLSRRKLLGLALAFGGVVIALADRGSGVARDGTAPSLIGDALALAAAISWAGIALVARGTSFREVRPDAQLYWQVLVSAPVLLVASLAFGPLLRDLQPWHLAGLAYQGIVVAAAGFVFWLWLLSVYPPSGVASFSFLTPVFGVALGWLLLGESVGPPLIAALVLVAVGIVLINRPRPPA
ncbi:MAG: hypothetical protein RLZZ528_2278 [Pseudomonadota bacterium]|jgi:drug/metabolite transporter (DMT)-like permease